MPDRRTTGTARLRRRPVLSLALLTVTLLATATATAVTRSGDGPDVVRAEAVGPAGVPPASGPEPQGRVDPATPPAPGDQAMIDVAVATLWLEPDMARPVDEPSLANPVEIRRWLSAMTTADRLGLVGRLATQALYGDRVTVLETRARWARVVVAGQPSSLHPAGYPGWLPVEQLRGGASVDTGRSAVVVTPTTELRDASGTDLPVMELTYATTLPVLADDDRWVTVATPGGGPGRLARDDVELSGVPSGSTRGSDVAGSADRFSGVPYLWGGTSGLGFDCSGLTWAVYRAHGIGIPRDAGDQAVSGSAVDPRDLEPGDLLFYSSEGSRDTIHHVSMYVGDGRMIQSPATGKTVETVPVDTPAYAREFWGARRYIAP